MHEPSEAEKWKKLQESYRIRGIVLAVGAGLSLGSGIPDWRTLLERLAVSAGIRGGKTFVSHLEKAGYSLPGIASAIRTRIDSPQTFLECVRKGLYKDFELNGHDIKGSSRDDFLRNIRTTNTTLRAVAAFCAVRDGGYRRNPDVHAIANFNLDTIFREFVVARYGGLVRTIERPSEQAYRGQISVYHMHGNLRFDSHRGELGKESDQLVLTSEEYFDFFNRPTGMFTHTFLTLLRDWPVLFVGLSMRDDNIRRLLHYSTTELVQAFLAKDKEKGTDEEKRDRARERALRHFAILCRKNDTIDRMDELTLLALGTRVLWLNTWGELPEKLGLVYAAGPGRRAWTDVFDMDPPAEQQHDPARSP